MTRFRFVLRNSQYLNALSSGCMATNCVPFLGRFAFGDLNFIKQATGNKD
jgi:hypothetical protein